MRWREQGILPRAGGILDQPLDLLVGMLTLNSVHDTWKGKDDEGVQWSDFSVNELHLIKWLEEGMGSSVGR